MSLLGGDGPLVKPDTHITHTCKVLECISEFSRVIGNIVLRPDDGHSLPAIAERIRPLGSICCENCETGDSSLRRFSCRKFTDSGFYFRRCRRLLCERDLLNCVRGTDSPAGFRHRSRHCRLCLHRFTDCQLSNLAGAGVTVGRFCDNCRNRWRRDARFADHDFLHVTAARCSVGNLSHRRADRWCRDLRRDDCDRLNFTDADFGRCQLRNRDRA